jgi:enoyl-CoA hydratase/carnithine racemase
MSVGALLSHLHTIKVEIQNGICIVYLSRPPSNGFTLRMAAELDQLFAHIDVDDEVKVVVLAGKGKYFCVGMDLNDGDSEDAPTGTQRDSGGVASLSIFHCTKPVIAAIHGAAVGIGITMTLACDIRVVEEDTIVGFIFAQRGLSVEACSSFFLPRLVGMTKAMDWCLTARKFIAKDEKESGLFTHVVPKGQSLQTALQIANDVMKNLSQHSVILIKRSLWAGAIATHPHTAHNTESYAIQKCRDGPDLFEGISSFLEKRSPSFSMSKKDIDMAELDSQSHWQARLPPSKL